jgi:cell division protein ZapE
MEKVIYIQLILTSSLVGTGKTMLMDLFYNALPESVPKRRVHFAEFVSEINTRTWKKRKLGSEAIPFVGKALAKELQVLCFDEFQMPDVGTANTLQRLLSAAIAEGLVVVATSNLSPKDVCTKGLHHSRIGNFLEVLEQEFVVHPIGSNVDYRLTKDPSMYVYTDTIIYHFKAKDILYAP